MKYTSGNTTIDAIQFNGEYTDEIYDFAKNDITGHNKQGNFLLIETKRSFVTCHSSDWLVRYPDGTLMPVKASTFAATYEVVE